jgi:hypothetical protein
MTLNNFAAALRDQAHARGEWRGSQTIYDRAIPPSARLAEWLETITAAIEDGATIPYPVCADLAHLAQPTWRRLILAHGRGWIQARPPTTPVLPTTVHKSGRSGREASRSGLHCRSSAT